MASVRRSQKIETINMLTATTIIFMAYKITEHPPMGFFGKLNNKFSFDIHITDDEMKAPDIAQSKIQYSCSFFFVFFVLLMVMLRLVSFLFHLSIKKSQIYGNEQFSSIFQSKVLSAKLKQPNLLHCPSTHRSILLIST